MKEMKVEPIGFLHTGFKEKFGVPRQSSMVGDSVAILKLKTDLRFKDALRHLDGFSHVWIVFVFHQHLALEWRPLITPPRLDAPRRVGVFASRSPHRPNSIGISAVKLESIDFEASEGIELRLSGHDFLDGTPVLDIKPYIPYADSISNAREGWTGTEIPVFEVTFEDSALESLNQAGQRNPEFHRGDLRELVVQTLRIDPRPVSQRKSMPIANPSHEGKSFACRMLDFDVHWEIRNGGIRVIRIQHL
jgi:tRNA-Thr(GGU) m(6)t(6)A37 methyltransferase TsaA